MIALLATIAMATLAQAWESSAVIRGRFRKQISWIQFPIPVQKETRDTDSQKQQKTKKDKTDKADPHLPTTRALELNVEILEKMLDHCSNEFLEVGKLQKEACVPETGPRSFELVGSLSIRRLGFIFCS